MIFNSRQIILLWMAIGLSLVLYLFSSLDVRSDISFFLPEDQTTVDKLMTHQLTQGEAGKIILIALSDEQSASSKGLAEINKRLTAELKNNKQFVSVQNGSLSLSELMIEPYYHYRYLLQSHSKTDFSKPSLEQSFAQLLTQLQLIASPMQQRLFAQDPQMIWLGLLQQWQTQKLQKHHGVWFDQQAKHSLLFVKTRADAYDLKQQQKNIDAIASSLQQLMQNDDTLSYILTGAPVFALASKKSISTQIKTISVIASITLMAFLFWFFRSVKIIILIGLPLGFAVLTGMTLVMLMDGFIHGITIAFGITIIGIAVDYPVHLYSHILFSSTFTASSKKKFSQKDIMQSIWPLIRLGLITTVIGFSAISLSDFSGLRQLGLFAISGLLAAAMVTRFLLPAIPVVTEKNTEIYNKLLCLVNYPLPRWIYTLSIILPVLALFYISTQQTRLWQNDLAALSPIPQQQKQQDFELRKAMGLPELRHTLILQADTIEQLLQQSELLKPHLEELKQQKIISAYDMANHYLPSIQLQQRQQEKLPEAGELKSRLEKVLSNSPLSATAFSAFIEAVANSKKIPPLVAQSLLSNEPNHSNGDQKSDFITDKIKALLFQEQSNWTAIIPLQGVRQEVPIEKLNQQVNFSVRLLDLKTQSETMLGNYRNEALLWFLCGTLLIMVVLFSHRRKPAEWFAVVWPFCGAVILSIASLLLMGYSLSIFHLVTLLLVVGLGIDYSIFMQHSLPAEQLNAMPPNEITQSSEVAQVSVIICLVSTLIMFGALSLSELPVLKAIGLTASLGALYAFLLVRTTPKQ